MNWIDWEGFLGGDIGGKLYMHINIAFAEEEYDDLRDEFLRQLMQVKI